MLSKMFYYCHLLVPFAVVFVLALTFIPAVDRGLGSGLGSDLGVAVFRLLLVFLTAYIGQRLVERYCDVRHCELHKRSK